RVATLFFVYASNLNTPEIQAITGVVRPQLAEMSDKIHFNQGLFERVSRVHDGDNSALDAEQKRLLEKTWDGFVQSGAQLAPEARTRVAEINLALATLFTDVANRVQADEDTWVTLTEGDL